MTRLTTILLISLLAISLLSTPVSAQEEDGKPEEDLTGLELFLITVLPMSIFPIIFIGMYIWAKKFDKRMEELARQIGVQYTAGGFIKRGFVEGQYRGRDVKFYTYTVGHGKHSTRYIQLKMRMNKVSANVFTLTREGFSSKLLPFLKKGDIEVHDVEFDPKFLVKSNDPTLPERVLKDQARRDLLEFTMWRFSWERDEVTVTRTGSKFVPDDIYRMIETVTSITDEFERL